MLLGLNTRVQIQSCRTALDRHEDLCGGARTLCTANPERSSLASVSVMGQGRLETEPRVWCIGCTGSA